jgi:hypothetical protein
VGLCQRGFQAGTWKAMKIKNGPSLRGPVLGPPQGAIIGQHEEVMGW